MKILAIDPKELRECPKCGKTKELSRFIVKSKRNNGQARWCQDCRREYKKNYDTKNAEKIKNNATVEEIKKVYDFYKSIEGSTSNNENS